MEGRQSFRVGGRTAPREGVEASNLQELLGRWSQVMKYAWGAGWLINAGLGFESHMTLGK